MKKLIALIPTGGKSKKQIKKEAMEALNKPKYEQCVLWKKPKLIADSGKTPLKVIVTYYESSHDERLLMECTECGQLYLKVLYEHVDWLEGNDKIYVSYIPVASSEQAEGIKDGEPVEYLPMAPRIRWDYDDKLPVWVREAFSES